MDDRRYRLSLVDNADGSPLATVSLPLVPRQGEHLRLPDGGIGRAGLYRIDTVVHAVTATGEEDDPMACLYLSFVTS